MGLWKIVKATCSSQNQCQKSLRDFDPRHQYICWNVHLRTIARVRLTCGVRRFNFNM